MIRDRLSVVSTMCAAAAGGDVRTWFASRVDNSAGIVERAENEVYPDRYALMILGWRAPRREHARSSEPNPMAMASRTSRDDFAEKVREFLDREMM